MRAGGWSLMGCLLLAGCYRAHERAEGTPGRDSGRRRVDVGPPACSGFRLLDRQTLTWPSFDCGGVSHTEMVARGAGFDAIATETRTCRDRPAQVAARRLTVETGSLRWGDVAGLGLALADTTPAAAIGNTLALCAGLTLRTFSAEYGTPTETALADEPVSVPGCPMWRRCVSLAAHETQWMALFSFFECDVRGHATGIYNVDGTTRGTPGTTWEQMSAVSSYDGGWALATVPRGTSRDSTLWRWEVGAAAPTEIPVRSVLPVEPVEVDVAVAAFPWAPGHVSVVFATSQSARGVEVTWLVINGRGTETLRRTYHPFDAGMTLGFGLPKIALATTRDAFVIATTASWSGGAARGLLGVLALRPNGEPIGTPWIDMGPGAPGGRAAIASDGTDVIVHARRRAESETETEALLFGCR